MAMEIRLSWRRRAGRLLPHAFALLATASVLSCAEPQQLNLPNPIVVPSAESQGSGDSDAPKRPVASAAERMPTPPRTAPDRPTQKSQPTHAAVDASGDVNINFEQVPLTTLIQVVYSEILGRAVNMDPQVMERRDLVTFRTPARQTPRQVQDAMRLLLKSYGLAAVDLGGLVRVVPDSVQTGQLPEIRRGSALPETPDVLRPVFQIVELQAVRNTDVAGWLNTIMAGRVTVAEDPARNALMLTGTSEAVAAAMEAIRVLDQPVMRGRASVRIAPVYLAAEELGRRLNEVLAAEGYSVPPPNFNIQQGGIRYPLIILPIAASNALLVFSNSEQTIAHVQEWVAKLDRPSEHGPGHGFVSYTAQYVSALELARTLGQVLAGGGSTPGASPAAPAPAPASAQSLGASATQSSFVGGTGGVVVDEASNTLIFRTTPEEYSYIVSLLRTLDRPAPSALIEVTVAEIQLTDDSQLGIEWLITESLGGGSIVGGTLGGLSIGSGGLLVKKLDSAGDVRLVVNALASSNRATILSSPRVMARNAEEATIQVGQEVPIITSQQSSLSGTTNGDLGVLQSVEYRSTGVILTVKPTIHPGDRIDLDVSQEVSAAQSTLTGVDNSPTFSTRNVKTSLTLKNGSTVLLGGLIANGGNGGNAGIPLLKDIPGVGQLFRTNTNKQNRTELIVLITPYIIRDDEDAQAVTEAFKGMLPWLGTTGAIGGAVPAPGGEAGAETPTP